MAAFGPAPDAAAFHARKAAVLLEPTTIQPNRRAASSRRGRHRISFRHFMFGGRRTSLRRAEDRRGLILVDEYSPRLVGFIVLLLALSVVDGFMILYLLNHW
jgi:hypothetical protein